MLWKYLRRAGRWLRKILPRVLLLLLAAAALLALAVGGELVWNGWLLWKDASEEKSLTARVDEVRAAETYLTMDELPEDYAAMVVAVEDRRFYQHSGIDLRAIGRALLSNLQSRSLAEGGSTITQQLAKNLFFSSEKRMERKVAEVFAAHALEEQYSKDAILELYISTIYYGSGCTGLESAAQGYFGVHASYLTPLQCTLLVGLPKAPSVYSPDHDPQLTLQRQAVVVSLLEQQGLVSASYAQHLLDTAPLALHRWMDTAA